MLDPEGNLNFDSTLDISSLYGAFMFEYGNDKSFAVKTAEAVEVKLLNSSPSGGVPRYEGDNYFAESTKHQGNPWFVATAWLAQYYVRTGKTNEAAGLINWMKSHLSPANTLPEQIGAHTASRVGVEPLVWSHAELINTLLDMHSN